MTPLATDVCVGEDLVMVSIGAAFPDRPEHEPIACVESPPRAKLGQMSACCSPSGESVSPRTQQPIVGASGRDVELVELPGGEFWMGAPPGDGYADDGEGPVHLVQLGAFSIAPTTVTNADYAAFCDATGHVTLAEADRWSFVFGGLLPDDYPPTRGVACGALVATGRGVRLAPSGRPAHHVRGRRSTTRSST